MSRLKTPWCCVKFCVYVEICFPLDPPDHDEETEFATAPSV